MSSTHIVEPRPSGAKKDDNLIIVVNDDGTISVDQETLQNLIMNQANANVSVVRVGQTESDASNGELTFTVDPPAFLPPPNLNQMTTTTIATTTTITTAAATTATATTPDIVDPFMEMDPEQLERLETALQSEQAKQILGENVTAMLDMLTVEEQQNSIRYSIELDHCYTSRTSPADPPPLDPLPVANSPDVEKVDFTPVPAVLQSPIATEEKPLAPLKSSPKKPGRPRKTPAVQPGGQDISSKSSFVSPPPDESQHMEEDSQSTTSESSESEPSDDDLDFGPRGPRRGGVRARGGRKGLTTRGGTLGARRPGRPCKMDVDQVRRLNLEMAAAVDEMKTPIKLDMFNDVRKRQVRTMGGKRKEEIVNVAPATPTSPAVAAPALSAVVAAAVPVSPAATPAPATVVAAQTPIPPPTTSVEHLEKPLQTTNAVKASLINANMIKGDMIVTRPGQSKNTPKVYFVPKKMVVKANEIRGLGLKKSPVVITKGPIKIPSQLQTKLTTSKDGKLIAVVGKQVMVTTPAPVTTPPTNQIPQIISGPAETVDPVAIIPKAPLIAPVKVKTPELKKEKKEKVEKIEKSEKAVEIAKPQEPKTPESCKKHLKKEPKKPPIFEETLGPALFSTPDIIRRVGSVGEAKAPDTEALDTSVPSINTSMDNQMSPIKQDSAGVIESKAQLEMLEQHVGGEVNQEASGLMEMVHDVDNKIDPKQAADDLNAVLDSGSIESNEHFLATLEMEASKHEEELLAEALLLQEQLDVDLSDPSALDGSASSALAEPLLSTADFASAILSPSSPVKLPEPPTSTLTPIHTPTPTAGAAASPPPPPSPSVSTPTPTQDLPTPGITPEVKKKEPKEPIQIVRGGRVITLPPIEAPATRSKRLQSKAESSPKTPAAKREGKSHKSTPTHAKKIEDMDSELEDDEGENSDSEDDPNRLWCICKRPHNNRFMICCDVCEDWFHGKCVHVSNAMGHQMEEQGIEWVCPNCTKKKSEDLSSPAKPSQPKTPKFTKAESKTTPAEKTTEKVAKVEKVVMSQTQCVVCKKEARNSSIYCSDVCILAHAQEALTKDKPVSTSLKTPAKESKADSRVIVFERKTGKLLSGTDAPTRSNLQNWLREHPTFEAVRSGSLNTIQIGNKTMQAIQTSTKPATNLGKSPPGQVKMVYAKVAGSKQTILAPSKKITIVSAHASAVTPKAQIKQAQVKSPQVLKQTTLKTVPQPAKSPVVKQQKEAKREQKPGSSDKKMHKLQISKKSELEPIRLNVRKSVADVLSTRIKETQDLKLTDTEITQLALDIELEMYKYFKEAGAKYKAKYRSLVFNIKDTKNLTLFRKIADRSLTPDAVVRLSPEEMASQELAEWREKETKHQLEMIKKNELDMMAQAKSIVVKTHKGEQIIENEGGLGAVDPKIPVADIVSVLNNADNSMGEFGDESMSLDDSRSKFQKHEDHKKKKKEKEKDKEKQKEKDVRRSREREHKEKERSSSRSRRHRSRDRSRDRRKSKDGRRDKEKDHHRTDKDKDKDRGKSREKDKTKDKEHSRRSSKSSRRSSHKEKEKKRSDIEDDKKKVDDKRKEIVPEKSIDDRPWRHVEEETTTNTLDGNDSDVSDREPSSTVNIKTPDINEELEKEVVDQQQKQQRQQPPQPVLPPREVVKSQPTVWRGFVNMPDVAKFFITVQEISGQAKDLMDALPDTINVVGRIASDTVWEWIAEVKKMDSKEILVIRLTAANDEEKIPYITLYSYLHSLKRLGVIGSVSNHIKDFYIMPFSSHSQVPPVLFPLIGPSFEENRPHLLLGIIIRNKHKRLSTSAMSQVPLKIAKKDSNRSYTPPPAHSKDKILSLSSSDKSHGEALGGDKAIAQTSLNSLNKAVISKIVPELSSKLDLTASPEKPQDDDDNNDGNDGAGDVGEGDGDDDNNNNNNNEGNDEDDDDDEPYSPGGMDDDSDDSLLKKLSTTSSLLPCANSNPSDIQRKMEELTRQIEEQKQQIQSISSSFLEAPLPGLGLDPPAKPGDDEAYSPTDARSFTPPPQSSMPKFQIFDKVQDITIPHNLQEILANVKRQESKVDPYLPSKPGASFLTSVNAPKCDKVYTPTAKESKSTLRSLSDLDLIKKAEEELKAVAMASGTLKVHAKPIMADIGSKVRLSEQPKPPGLEDEELPVFPSTPPTIETRSTKFVAKSGVVLSVKRKTIDEGSSAPSTKTPRTKSRWGQGPTD